MKNYSEDEIKENFKIFFEEEGLTSDIIRVAENYPDERSIEITYGELMDHFEMEFPEFIHKKPRICLDLATEAMNEILGSSYEETSIRLRIKDIPEAHNKGIRELRAEDLTQFIGVKGLVRKATEVRPRITTAVFQCMRCGATIKQPQSIGKIEEPMECQSCGKSSNKTSFKLLLEDSEFTDYQTLEIQESPEDLRGGEQPQRLKGWTKEDLVGTVSPGDRIT
ncbi:MAG: hypothetical protein ACOC1V_06065, partial [Candidatus Saliniplasma sp.]